MAAIGIKALISNNRDIGLVLALAGLIFLMVIPLPPFMLDLFLVTSIAFSVLILLISVYANKPLDFSVFPTMLLFSTLLRLSLNIASTRLILLHGGDGQEAAGQVIKSFGHFVVGGNYVVGTVVFIILVIINFVVITKGAGRIAEVAARFTLDAMPGKQLAIDADLNAGIINNQDAIARREAIGQEADFYGAMDGASKFVRGDAIAGILITIINVVGGFIIGVAQQGMPLIQALQVYTILTVGDGLVAQIPALIVSLAAGLIVTKVSKKDRLADEITMQAFSQWRPLAMIGVMLLLMGAVPGLPKVPFFIMALAAGFVSYRAYRAAVVKSYESQAAVTKGSASQEAAPDQKELVPQLDVLEFEVGYDLISLVDQRSGGELPARIVGIRKQFASEMGILLPPVHIRDNLKLRPTEYRILLKGAVVGTSELLPQHSLALDPGTTTRRIEGIETKDPTFGLDALWIPDEQKEKAIIAGYTVVDLPSVAATHLMEIVRRNLNEIFGRQDLSTLLEQLKTTHPRVVADLIPDMLPFGTVLKVLQNLLHERVSVRDLLTIMETLAEYAPSTKDSSELTEHVRVALGRSISQQYVASDQNLYVITLDRTLEEKLVHAITPTNTGPQIAIDPDLAKEVVERLGNEAKRHLTNNQPPVVLTSQQVRPHLFRLIERFIPNLAVLAHSEVAGRALVKPLGMIGEPA